MIFVNYKSYEESSGEKALLLTKKIEDVVHESQIKIIPVVQALDAGAVISSTTLEVWMQHIDPFNYGAHTGWVIAEEVARMGVSGVFLNHSEHKFSDFESLRIANEKAKEANLKTLIFAGNLEELKNVITLSPTFVAYEPPELIGSTETSVARAQPEIISQAVGIAREKGLPLIVGAGVSSADDIRKSLEIGAVGVALATAVVKAPDPKAKLLELVEGFK